MRICPSTIEKLYLNFVQTQLKSDYFAVMHKRMTLALTIPSEEYVVKLSGFMPFLV